jgi:hypothetical protein
MQQEENYTSDVQNAVDCMKPRAIRRHHYARLKKVRKGYWAYVPEQGDGALGIIINTPKRCGGACCKNPRKNGWGEDLTVAEKKANIDMKEQLEEVKMETTIKEIMEATEKACKELNYTQREEYIFHAFVREGQSLLHLGLKLGVSPFAVEKELRSALSKIIQKIEILKKALENSLG